MYVGGTLDTAPATSSSTLSRSQASHREVKVRKVNPSHSVSPPVLEYREVDRIATETGLQGLDHPEGNYPLSLCLSTFWQTFQFPYIRDPCGDRPTSVIVHGMYGRSRSFSTACSMVVRRRLL